MPFPQGVGGVQLSLEQIAQRVREGANDVDVQGWAYDQLRAAGIDGRSALDTATRKMAVLLDAVRAATVYSGDPPNSETIKSAASMLCLRPNLCIRGGDCDDQTVLLGSVLMSVGIPISIVKQTFGAADQEHVLIHAQDEMGNWIAADPSTSYPLGQSARASSEFAVDPLNPSMIGLVGVPDAEFVGIGAVPAGYHLVGSSANGNRRLPTRMVGVVSSTDVVRLQADVLAQANALDRTVVGCLSKIPAARLQQWGPLLKRATDYANEDPSWWFAGAQVDAGLAIQADLAPWYDLLKGYGCSNVPLQPAPPPSTFGALSGLVTTVAIAAGVVAVAYAVSKVAGTFEAHENSRAPQRYARR